MSPPHTHMQYVICEAARRQGSLCYEAAKLHCGVLLGLWYRWDKHQRTRYLGGRGESICLSGRVSLSACLSEWAGSAQIAKLKTRQDAPGSLSLGLQLHTINLGTSRFLWVYCFGCTMLFNLCSFISFVIHFIHSQNFWSADLHQCAAH